MTLVKYSALNPARALCTSTRATHQRPPPCYSATTRRRLSLPPTTTRPSRLVLARQARRPNHWLPSHSPGRATQRRGAPTPSGAPRQFLLAPSALTFPHLARCSVRAGQSGAALAWPLIRYSPSRPALRLACSIHRSIVLLEASHSPDSPSCLFPPV